MMTELQINQLIHEKVMGKCWHIRNRTTEEQCSAHVLWRKTDTTQPYPHLECVKCGMILSLNELDNPSYASRWEFYGPMIEECMKKEWFSDFAYEWDDRWIGWIREYLFNPLNGTTAIAEFVVDNPQYFKGEKP